MSASKAIYKPLSIATSVAGGLIAGKIFTEVWQRVNPSDEEPPEPQDLSRSTREAFVAAAHTGFDLRPCSRGVRAGRGARLSGAHKRGPVLAHGIM